MRQDKRSKTERVAAVLAMAKERGRPVSRKVARSAVAWRCMVAKAVAHANLYNGPVVAAAAMRGQYQRINLNINK